jgi:hypothetical protein
MHGMKNVTLVKFCCKEVSQHNISLFDNNKLYYIESNMFRLFAIIRLSLLNLVGHGW